MPNRIIIDDNSKEYEVVNRRGAVLGTFFINPTDFNIAARAEEAVERIDQIIKDMEQNQDMSDESAMEELKAAGEAAKREVDYIFNGNALETFFAKVNPFSLVDGKFYIENVIVAIQAVIKKEFNAEIKRSRQRISKYTGKYTNPPANMGKKRKKQKNKNWNNTGGRRADELMPAGELPGMTGHEDATAPVV